jgi:predicted aconitase
MLAGELGEPLRFAMEMLSALGEINDAEKMIPIKYAHVAGLSFKTHGMAGLLWAEEMAAKGARVAVPTTYNVSAVDRSRDLGQPASWTGPQLRIGGAYERMGVYGTSSCVPYLYGFTPLFGQSVAWAESSAVIYSNSVLGARDNREGGPSALAAALAGRTADYGMHRPENRHGDVLYKVTAPIRDYADYGALGTWVGRRINSRIPVFEGLPDPSVADLVSLSGAIATVSNCSMFHAVGVTPEAPDLARAFGGRKGWETAEIGPKELEEGRESLQHGHNRLVDYVAIGCPHANIEQIAEVAGLLGGRKVNGGVLFLIHTNVQTKALAKQLGLFEAIERTGAKLTQDFCTPLGDPEDFGVKVMATNSSRCAFYGPHNNGLEVRFGTAAQCVEAAVSGRWAY